MVDIIFVFFLFGNYNAKRKEKNGVNLKKKDP